MTVTWGSLGRPTEYTRETEWAEASPSTLHPPVDAPRDAYAPATGEGNAWIGLRNAILLEVVAGRALWAIWQWWLR